jgi:hypothetical protein
MRYLKVVGLLCCLTILPAGSALAASGIPPSEVGGFILGTSIEEYDFISYRNFLKQVVIDRIPGFRKGMIEYGVCKRPGDIVRIKLKYQDTSKAFYKKLFKQYKKRFGKPDEFTGDSFGIVICWRWNFRTKDGERVTMLLQHNLKNPNEVTGNMVKLAMPDRIEAERKCFNKTCDMRSPGAFSKSKQEGDWDKSGWQNMIPR